VAVFEQAMQALQRHDYGQAAATFRVLLERHASEGALVDRGRLFLARAEQELSRRPSEPRTVEERLTAATAALNNGDHDAAEALARAVLAEDPHQDLALYLLASVAARRGLYDAALSYLGQAIAISPEARAQARLEPDFEPLRDHDAFRELTEGPLQSSGQLGRNRRGRGER
jgi:tetratricopeptide (TPR) repeat protein